MAGGDPKNRKHKTPYTGPTVDSDSLWSESANDYVSDQAFIDSSYCGFVGSFNVLVGNDRNNCINGTTDNARTATFGQMVYQGGFDENPPSTSAKTAADAYNAWWISQHGH